MPPADEPTLGEVSRRLDALERRIDNGFANVGHQLESLQFVHRDLYETNQKAIWKAIDALAGKFAWQAKTIGGVLITSAITAFIVLISTRGGV